MSEVLDHLVFKLGSRAERFALKKNTSRPSSPIEGELDYDDTANQVLVYNGSSWDAVGAPAVDADNLEYSSGTLQFSAAAAGGGLTGGAGSALAVGAGTGITVNSNDVQVDSSTVQLKSEKGNANGYASLDSGGRVPSSQIPLLNTVDVNVVNSQVAQLALTAQEGDIAIRSDLSKTYVHNGGTAGTMADWTELATPTDAVTSVNGLTGAVTGLFSTAGSGLTSSGTTVNVGAGTDMTVNADDITPGTNIPRKNAANTFTAGQTIDSSTGLVVNDGSGVTVAQIAGASGSAQINFRPSGGGPFDAYLGRSGVGQLSIGSSKLTVGDAGAALDALNRQTGDARYAKASYAVDVGDNSSTTITVTHNLGTRDVQVAVRETASPYAYGDPTIKAATTNTVTLDFASAPSSGQFRCIVTV